MLSIVYFLVYLFAEGVPGSAIPLVPRYRLLGDERIVGGTPINITQAPHQVSLLIDGNHFCGGSIISSYHVLTVAHCISTISNDVNRLLIGSGSDNLRDIEKREAVRHVIHPKYYRGTMDYDVGVVKVKDPFVESAVRKPIALVGFGEQDAEGQHVTVTGWGETRDNTDRNLLHSVQVDIVGSESCNKSYPGSISPRMICAGMPAWGKDACLGDSGGAMVSQKTGKQAGIVSWGIGCARKEYPGVYTNLADKEIHDFIDSELKQLVN